MSEHFRGRAVLGTVTVGLVAALTLALTSGAALASAGTAATRTTAPQATDEVGVQATLIGGAERFWNHNRPPPVYRAHATISVYTNHRKDLWVNDAYAGDSIGLAIEIDPSGPQAPIVYWDKNGVANGGTSYRIWYSVRKWRFISVYQNGTIHNRAHPWVVSPLPWPDF